MNQDDSFITNPNCYNASRQRCQNARMRFVQQNFLVWLFAQVERVSMLIGRFLQVLQVLVGVYTLSTSSH